MSKTHISRQASGSGAILSLSGEPLSNVNILGLIVIPVPYGGSICSFDLRLLSGSTTIFESSFTANPTKTLNVVFGYAVANWVDEPIYAWSPIHYIKLPGNLVAASSVSVSMTFHSGSQALFSVFYGNAS